MAAVQMRPPGSDDVVGRVLRRAEVAKMARKLQDRLALASYKAMHGQESLSFRDVEARLDSTIKRKRAMSGRETSSTCSSSSLSDDNPHLMHNGLASSPLPVTALSDDLNGHAHFHPSLKRTLYPPPSSAFDDRSKRHKSSPMGPPSGETARFSWKSVHRLPQSSPDYPRSGSAHFSTANGPDLSFASEISTMPDSPPFGHMSDEDDRRISRHSYAGSNSAHRSSPPRTPPPSHRRGSERYSGGGGGGGNGEEGADLLLYLATSPSPAQLNMRANRLNPPSTPPSRDHHGPSHLLATPGMTGLSTPGQHFNFADFVNITPSPAQGAFAYSRTPGLTKTPLAARDAARRRLNLDTLAPPGNNNSTSTSNGGNASGSHNDNGTATSQTSAKPPAKKMELGGELVS